jgi:hypothetical protein
MTYRTFEPAAVRPPRRWPIVAPLVLVVVLAAAWSIFWFYAANRAQSELAAWQAREAAAGRNVSCGTQEFSGFPFRFELRCGTPALGLRNARLAFKAQDLHAAVLVYQPALAVAEIEGPLTATEEGRGGVTVGWALAQASVHGLSRTPERVSLVLDKPTIARLADNGALANAAHAEIHVRAADRQPQDPPALDLALNLAQALFLGIARVPSVPIDADVTGTLRGIDRITPKPWPQLLRDLQTADGRLDISQVRIKQGDILGVGRGTLKLTPRGTLDGELELTVAGIEQLMTALGLDKAVGQASQKALDRFAPGLNLDKLLGPRGNAALAAAGAAMLGQPTQLEGRQAVTLPLRFADGVVFLGPVKVAEMAPLF